MGSPTLSRIIRRLSNHQSRRNLNTSSLTQLLPSTGPFSPQSLSRLIPTILTPTLWRRVTPRALRSSSPSSTTAPSFSDTHRATTSASSLLRNPAFQITLLSILCGSQAIHVLSQKNVAAELESKRRKKVALLNGVIERILAGESVDVREELGTGTEEGEQEWKEVLEGLKDAEGWLKEGRRGKGGVKDDVVQTQRSGSWLGWLGWGGMEIGKKEDVASIEPERKAETIPDRPAFF